MILKKLFLALPITLIVCPNIIHLSNASTDSLVTFYFSYVIDIVLLLFGLYFLFNTAFRDPGYEKPSSPGHSSKVTINSQPFELKICKICNILKQPRTSHCKDCKKCVQRRDQHISLLNNCIGSNNQIYFFCLQIFCSIQGIFILSSTTPYVLFNQNNDLNYFLQFMLFVYGILNFFFIGSYTVLQIYLVTMNLTFHELVKKKSDFNVFMKDWKGNWDDFFK